MEKTKGIFFLGVPHYGTKVPLVAELLSCIACWRGSSMALLQYTLEGNPALINLEYDFYNAYIYCGQTRAVGVPYIVNFLEMTLGRNKLLSLGVPVS